MQDLFGRNITYLRLSVTELCNLRCRYCMPAEGVQKRRHEDMLTEEETVQAVQVASELGIRKVRVTGGEPLVKRNILSLCEKIATTPGIQEVCLTTNGTLLPVFATSLRDAGVKRINISLDTLDSEKYSSITRGGKLEDALKGLDAALNAGFDQVKINIVLIGGFNEDEIPSFVALTKRRPLDVRFIELMPMAGSSIEQERYISGNVVLTKAPELIHEPEVGIVARLYRLPGALGRVGIISPISCPFCDRCDRIRLTADGKLKPCLHKGAEFSIKGLNKEDMRAQFEAAIRFKPSWHGELSPSIPSQAGRSMNRIGG